MLLQLPPNLQVDPAALDRALVALSGALRDARVFAAATSRAGLVPTQVPGRGEVAFA